MFSIFAVLLLLLILLARRSKRQPSYPENLQFVNETMGPSNVEGFEEKDATRFDLNMLRVTPDGQLISEDKREFIVNYGTRLRINFPISQIKCEFIFFI